MTPVAPRRRGVRSEATVEDEGDERDMGYLSERAGLRVRGYYYDCREPREGMGEVRWWTLLGVSTSAGTTSTNAASASSSVIGKLPEPGEGPVRR